MSPSVTTKHLVPGMGREELEHLAEVPASPEGRRKICRDTTARHTTASSVTSTVISAPFCKLSIFFTI